MRGLRRGGCALVVAIVALLGATIAHGLSTSRPPVAVVPDAHVKMVVPSTGSLRPAVLSSLHMKITAKPVPVPLIVEIPSIGVHSHLLAVGMTSAQAMDAPEGGANSPFWADTFWYRGGAVPGADGTATIAGHIDDAFGRYAVFGHLSQLVRGDTITIRNSKTGFSVHFAVTSVHLFTLAQSKTMKVLDLIYGTGPPRGEAAQPSKDGLARLSLVTCAGTWENTLGTHDERLVVSAVRIT